MGDEGALFMLDLATGQKRDSRYISFPVSGSTPAVADGVAYLAGVRGEVAAYELATDHKLWETTLDAGTSSSPLVIDGTLYIGANDDALYALDITDGRERWRFEVGEGSDYTWGPSPSFADGVIFFPCASAKGDTGLFAIDVASGEDVWQFEPDAPGLFTPAVVGGTLYLGGNGGDVYALDIAIGEARWKTTLSSIWSTPAVTSDLVIVQTMSGMLAGLDRASGEPRWSVETGASWSSPVVAGDTAYVVNNGLAFEAGLYAVNVRDGSLRWHLKGIGGGSASVAVSGEVLVVATDDGVVYGVTGSDAEAVDRGTDGADVFLTPLSFTPDEDEQRTVFGPEATLPAGTAKVSAGYGYAGMEEGAAWEAVWTLDGEPLFTRPDTWTRGSSGQLFENLFANEGSLPTGRYVLELRVNGTPVRRGEVVIG
jgi:outer membrane protein assembly factor BamB